MSLDIDLRKWEMDIDLWIGRQFENLKKGHISEVQSTHSYLLINNLNEGQGLWYPIKTIQTSEKWSELCKPFQWKCEKCSGNLNM
jgi:hypothetical protein